MQLFHLPEEILIMIIKKLDTEATYNLYNTCSSARNIVRMKGVVKMIKVSMNKIAYARFLKFQFFSDMSTNLQVLNLCAVSDLRISTLLPTAKKLKNLKSLNISFTTLSIMDLIKIYDVCPTITDVTVNCDFGDKAEYLRRGTVPATFIKPCQELFKNFKDVHLVGSRYDLLYSMVPLFILKESILDSLSFTIVVPNRKETFSMNFRGNISFSISLKNFNMYIMDRSYNINNYAHLHSYEPYTCILKSLSNIEFVIVSRGSFDYLHKTKVYMSSFFENFFARNFNSNMQCIKHPEDILEPAVIMLFDKEKTNFDKEFYSNLTHTMTNLLVQDINTANSSKCDWLYAILKEKDDGNKASGLHEYEPKNKIRKSLQHILDYDQNVLEKNYIKLSIVISGSHQFDVTSPLRLPCGSDYLKKITYLSLNGTFAYSDDFFPTLFLCCTHLETLTVKTSIFSPGTAIASISRYIKMSKSLKNLEIHDKMHFRIIFPLLGNCSGLRNVLLYDRTSSCNCEDLSAAASLIEKCKDLLSLVVYVVATVSNINLGTKIFNRMKNRYKRPYLYLNLCNNDLTNMCLNYSHIPYKNIFDPFYSACHE